MEFLVIVAMALLAAPAVLTCAYLLILTLLSGQLPVLQPSSRRLRFAVVVPAHNEESGIGRTVTSLQALDWDADHMRVYVVADNCTDQTEQRASAAGARVLVRQNANLRGKGYALAHAFEACLAEGWADALVVIDADAVVSANLLQAYAARIERGECAVQAHYGVLNPMESWRTRLISVAKGAFHIVRSRARERLGVSCGIRGNGWCVTTDLLRKVPYASFSLTEDLEYGIILGHSGFRVAYADEAHANADMVTSAVIARKQRQRWEAGRMELVRRFAGRTLVQALRKRDRVLLDLAMDLMVLPLSYVVINVLLLVVCGVALSWWMPGFMAFAWIGAACLLALVVHVLRGWQLSGTGIRGLTALFYVPAYLVWKVVIMMAKKTTDWVRTEREAS